MNIKYYTQGSKELVKLYIRIYHSSFDVACFTGIFCQLSDWNNSEQQLMNNTEMNIVLFDLKTSILKQFNKSFTSGEVINKNWLESSVKVFFNRPKDEDKLKNESHSIYFSDFANWWLENHSENWKVSSKKYISKVQIGQYRKFLDHFIEFEKSIDRKILLKDFTQDDIYELVNWYEENEYNQSTIEREIGRFKFFANRAFEEGLKVSSVMNQRIYVDKDSSDIEKPYLTFNEINKIINKDFSFDQELNIAKQNYVILLFTGLRGSDGLKNLDISNIQDGFIKIKTSKTGQVVVLPVHDEIKKVIKQNFGSLPPKISLYNFNKSIKTIAQICEIDQEIEGKLFDPIKKRKVRGFYKKYLLLSSHSCRRGFVTLHKDIISIDAMCSLLGWSSASMYKIYNQTSKKDYALELEKMWSNKK